MLCDDPTIRELNREWRGVDAPTDVLSFELEGDDEVEVDYEFEDEKDEGGGASEQAGGEEEEEEDDEDEEEEGEEDEDPKVREAGGGGGARGPPPCRACTMGHPQPPAPARQRPLPAARAQLPVTVLGDVIISLDTASRQAAERGHTLLDECRILLIHGVLHLLGYDHEQGERARHGGGAVLCVYGGGGGVDQERSGSGRSGARAAPMPPPRCMCRARGAQVRSRRGSWRTRSSASCKRWVGRARA